MIHQHHAFPTHEFIRMRHPPITLSPFTNPNHYNHPINPSASCISHQFVTEHSVHCSSFCHISRPSHLNSEKLYLWHIFKLVHTRYVQCTIQWSFWDFENGQKCCQATSHHAPPSLGCIVALLTISSQLEVVSSLSSSHHPNQPT